MTDAPLSLAPAPGARAAKLCGIWSLIASVTCVGIPIGVVLAIIALVQQAKAKRLAKENPDHYELPTNTGLVTGILGLAMPVVMLPFIGIVSAIAIPALLSQRSRERDIAVHWNMLKATGDLVGQYDLLAIQKTPLDQVPAALEAWLKKDTAADKNPWDVAAPAFNYHIEVVSDLDEAGMDDRVSAEASALGQPVFIIELPAQGRSGYLAGAVRTQTPLDGKMVSTNVVEIE